jgi:polysaccharide pyruvyl transferase WcaK-like protein
VINYHEFCQRSRRAKFQQASGRDHAEIKYVFKATMQFTMRPLKLCVFGAATDTSNMGVSALCYSTLAGIARREPDAEVTVFDNGKGLRPATLSIGDRDFEYRLCGGYNSRRYYRRESYWNMRVSGWFHGLRNPGTTAFLNADAILDVSGGDSFCDLYGAKVFRSNVMMKQMALTHRIPLVLLPQTYGPFQDPRRRAIAQEIIRKATMAWARDRRSFEVLQGLLGRRFDSARHMGSVDLAFGLETRRPKLPAWFLNVLDGPRRPVGLNISGLIYNDPASAKLRYGFKSDYREIVHRLLVRLLQQTDRSVILVPHVLCGPENVESDTAACEAAIKSLNGEYPDRVILLPALYDPSEIKWIIARTEWFCSTRMHSGIAALSSGVPTAAIAYSIKTAGVFESCNQAEHVADPRSSNLEEVIERLWWSWENRMSAKSTLSATLPSVVEKVEQQMDKLVAMLRGLKEDGNVGREKKPRL